MLKTTTYNEIDTYLTSLTSEKYDFARLSIAKRIDLLQELLQNTLDIAEEMARETSQQKGLNFNEPSTAEGWVLGPIMIVRNIRLLIESLTKLQHERPLISNRRMHKSIDERVLVEVFPSNIYDKLLFRGITANVRMLPDVDFSNVNALTAAYYRTQPDKRKTNLVLILGAGNVESIPICDVLAKMFIEGKLCILKISPVNAYLGPLFERIFAGLIRQHLFAIVYGGAEVGNYIAYHTLINEIHITGSDKIHDTIVWGTGAEGAIRKAKQQPLLQKIITSELGNISPVIVVPGPYSEKELAFQATSLAGAVTNNASFNCNATKLLIQARKSAFRDLFLNRIAAILANIPTRKAYYHGAEQRWQQIIAGHTHVMHLGKPSAGELPWTLITQVDPENFRDPVFTMEPFCSVLSETSIDGDSPSDFLMNAVKFANEKVWGTLNITIIIHPKTLKDPKVAHALELAISQLRYGMVGINLWPAIGYFFMTPPWGGYPSATLNDIQSGIGWVHNTFMLSGIEKTIIRSPLRIAPKPLWLPDNRAANKLAQAYLAVEAAPAWWKLPRVIFNAMRG